LSTQQVAVLREELGDRNLPLASSHLDAEMVVVGLPGFASGALASAAFGSAAGVLAVAASGFALDLALDLSSRLDLGAGLDLTAALDVRFAIALIDTSTFGGSRKCG